MHVLAAMRTTLQDDGTLAGPLEGELVVLPAPDVEVGDLGLCRREPRTFVGVDSHADIAAVEVVELAVTPQVILGHVRESLARRCPWQEDRIVDTAARLTAEMLSIAQQFPVGTILDKQGRLLQAQIPLFDHGDRRPVCGSADDGGGPW
ncbi:MAG TPA: hypothetical protein VK923_05395 [Euzebyales bacterium]|nr:hypothetical protein [Euzebyales bacterium]